jgi:LysM repeat protein
VAADFGVSEERLRRWNHLKSNNLRAGRTLVIYPPVSAETAADSAPAKKRKASKTSAAAKSKKTSSNASAGSGTSKSAKR